MKDNIYVHEISNPQGRARNNKCRDSSEKGERSVNVGIVRKGLEDLNAEHVRGHSN